MTKQIVDIIIIGAGPVGLLCAYLGRLCGLTIVIIDKSAAPLTVGRADALNARTLQLLEIIHLFDELYPLGKTCNTSSVWKDGAFVSRQSTWWDELEGCLHKHFLMLGQAYIEQLLDERLEGSVTRLTQVNNIELIEEGCLTTLSNGDKIQSRYVIGADGSRSWVRQHFAIGFEVVRPEIVWAVLDGVIETDFPKVPEIIVFQADTSDVAWIPREGDIDRFYVRMDKKDFSFEEAVEKINRAMQPHTVHFSTVVWFSQFSVKEALAERFFVHDRIFLVGDAGHIHSVNGGQGLNTGLADAFNLMWKLQMVIQADAPKELLSTYEKERQSVARGVIETSGELVRSTKYSQSGTHAADYVKIVQRRAGYITGMGIAYGEQGVRLYDAVVYHGAMKTQLYSLLDYTRFTLLICGSIEVVLTLPAHVNMIHIYPCQQDVAFWASDFPYQNQALLVRPDAYIITSIAINNLDSALTLNQLCHSIIHQEVTQ